MVADQAEVLALQALAFLAEDAQRLGNFLALTGLGPDELRAQAREPHLLAAVLDHLLRDENQLLVFAANYGVAPALIGQAHAALEELTSKRGDFE
jgi:Protein of unknown function (DUF3572)